MGIRLAAVGDIAGVAALVERYWEFESIGGYDRPRIEKLLGDLLCAPERGACWVAETDGRLCGYLLAAFMFSLEHGGRPSISWGCYAASFSSRRCPRSGYQRLKAVCKSSLSAWTRICNGR
jgi:hypothetical protein